MDGGAWRAAVHGVTEGQTRLSDFTFTFHFHALEKEMANPRDGGAWWAAVYGVTQSRTRLKWLSRLSRVWYNKQYTFGLCLLFFPKTFSKTLGISWVMNVFGTLMRYPDSFKMWAACQINKNRITGLEHSALPQEGKGAWAQITNFQWFTQ